MRTGLEARTAVLPVLLVAGIIVGVWCTAAPNANAVPHTISRTPHPFDPDWPDVYLIVMNKCSGCHRPGGEQKDYTSYEALMRAGRDAGDPVVVPGDAEGSPLLQYTTWNVHARADSDQPDSPEMPPDRNEWLTAGQLQILTRWVNNGAVQYRQSPAGRPLLEIDFPSAKQCAVCHPNQYRDWARSMHAYAMHSPAFEAFNLTLVERTAGSIGTFCTRCHSHIGTLLGENGSCRAVHRSRISMEGVTCVVCHRRKHGFYKASGRLQIEPGTVHDGCIYGPFDDAQSTQVAAHPSVGRPYMKTSQFCAECHDVFSPQGVRLEEAFSEWHNSPAARNNITCQNCHMGPVQGMPVADCERPLGRAAVVPGVPPERFPLRHLSDHTFAGPDYSLLPDAEFPYKLDWMYETDYRDMSRLTPHQQKTLIDLRRKNRKELAIAARKRYEVLRNGARLEVRIPSIASAGEKVAVHAKVISTFAGHSYPTGFTAERQLWVSVEVRDVAGNVVFASGDVDHQGDLRDAHSHDVLTGRAPYDPFLLNFQNKFVGLTSKGTERQLTLSVNRSLTPLNMLRPATGISASFGRPGTFRIAKASLPPLASRGQTYPIHLPDCGGIYTVDVRLNFRHLPPTLFDHIGISHLKRQLEVVLIDQHQGVIHIVD